LETLAELDDEGMDLERRASGLDSGGGVASIETLAHAFLPARFIDHTHADAVLALTNQADGDRIVREALGDEVLVAGYREPGFAMAKEASRILKAAGAPPRGAMVWMKHGLVTWAETAREAYARTIEVVTRAERYLEKAR